MQTDYRSCPLTCWEPRGIRAASGAQESRGEKGALSSLPETAVFAPGCVTSGAFAAGRDLLRTPRSLARLLLLAATLPFEEVCAWSQIASLDPADLKTSAFLLWTCSFLRTRSSPLSGRLQGDPVLSVAVPGVSFSECCSVVFLAVRAATLAARTCVAEY